MKTSAILAAVLAAGFSLQANAANSQKFNLNLFRNAAEGAESGKNFVISPTVTKLGLSMIYLGTGVNSGTQAKVGDALGYSRMPRAAVQSELQRLTRDLDQMNNGKEVQFTQAHALFVQQGYRPHQTWINALTADYNAKIAAMNIGKMDATLLDINTWVEKNTNEMIKNFVKKEDLAPDTRMALLSAVYFNGNWDQAFTPSLIKASQPFGNGRRADYLVKAHNAEKDAEGNPIPVKEEFYENARTGTQVLKLPFKQVRNEHGHVTRSFASIYFILPAKSRTAKQVALEEVSKEGFWQAVDQQSRATDMLRIEIPKFKVEQETDLEQPLTGAGIDLGILFSSPDLSQMGPGALYVSKAKQKAVFEIDEKGGRGAAAGLFVIGERSIQIPRRAEFIADREFLFAVRQEQEESQELLFMGIVSDPQAK
jgi:serine protease inhibitor